MDGSSDTLSRQTSSFYGLHEWLIGEDHARSPIELFGPALDEVLQRRIPWPILSPPIHHLLRELSRISELAMGAVDQELFELYS